jgi:PAS domain S-box-containing protein
MLHELDDPVLIAVCGSLVGTIVVLLLIIRVLKHPKNSNSGKVVSASKLAASLRDEKLKSEVILKGIDDGVVLIDDQQIIQSFNPGAATMTGWAENEAKGLNWASVFKLVNSKGEAVDDDHNPLRRVFKEGKIIHDNTANVQTKSDKLLAVNLTLSPLLDESQQVSGVIVVLRDVSQERKEEAQRAEFISTASHEMRTPVAAIEGYLALALNDKVSTIDSKARDYLEKAHASTQHLGKLFQDLLTSAKAEDGRLTSHPTVVEIGDFLQQLANDLRFAAEKKGMSMEFAVGANQTIDASRGAESAKVIKPLYYALADPDRLREVITNLFDNAVKYSEKGKITIGLTGNDQVVQFFVRDTGHGIPAEDVPHLFQKFYRVDNSATRTVGGTGLGLFISRKIVELYGGRIWVESELEKGSTFYINLPRLTSQKAEQLKAQAAASTELSPITSLAQ